MIREMNKEKEIDGKLLGWVAAECKNLSPTEKKELVTLTAKELNVEVAETEAK
jgi:hypothetical protein